MRVGDTTKHRFFSFEELLEDLQTMKETLDTIAEMDPGSDDPTMVAQKATALARAVVQYLESPRDGGIHA